jgi:hypothetical protein
MFDLSKLIVGTVIDLLRSRVMLEAEILMMRRANPERLRFASIDRLTLGGICRLFPKMYDTLAIVGPDTVIRWHRTLRKALYEN